MLIYELISKENIDKAIALVYSVFPYEFGTDDSPEEAYRTSLDKIKHKDFIERHNLKDLDYFIVKDFNTEKIVGVTGWYTENIDLENTAWLGWYCVDKNERGKGYGKEILNWTVDQVKQRGFKVFKLYTSNDDNEKVAQKLYESMGFKIIKEGDEFLTIYREKVL